MLKNQIDYQKKNKMKIKIARTSNKCQWNRISKEIFERN